MILAAGLLRLNSIEEISRLLVYSMSFIDHFLSLVQGLELRMRKSQTQGNHEVSSAANLRDFLVAEGFNTKWS